MKKIKVPEYRRSEIMKYWKETTALQHANTPKPHYSSISKETTDE
jgi:hypothetical protein